MGPLERANLSHWASGPLHLRAETDPVSETSCFTPKNTGQWTKSKNPIVLYIFACCMLHIRFLLGLFFYPEDGRNVFL
jgi:hypothetical protein